MFLDYSKELHIKPAIIRFRRWVVRTETIAVQTQNHESTTLFNPTDFPARIIIGYIGQGHLNKIPFKEPFNVPL